MLPNQEEWVKRPDVAQLRRLELVGRIYGKPAADALTPNNHFAELYGPGVLQDEAKLRKRWKVTGFMRFCRWIGRWFRAIRGVLGRR